MRYTLTNAHDTASNYKLSVADSYLRLSSSRTMTVATTRSRGRWPRRGRRCGRPRAPRTTLRLDLRAIRETAHRVVGNELSLEAKILGVLLSRTREGMKRYTEPALLSSFHRLRCRREALGEGK